MRRVLGTNVDPYSAPGFVDVRNRYGYQVLGHDKSLANPEYRKGYSQRENVTALSAQTPREINLEM